LEKISIEAFADFFLLLIYKFAFAAKFCLKGKAWRKRERPFALKTGCAWLTNFVKSDEKPSFKA
jgi:hypothetical protein